MLVKDRREKRLPERSIDMIILLTDGDPSYGEHEDCVTTFLYICVSAHLMNILSMLYLCV